ncbi:prolyl oligopeptidase family-domain-containing protein [Catenaria anguillulae PL171]|uniref:Prolyl endopeptidase n=1 Tax=Catenaria anguillulae PL171 TaxID=765915 RepID=A0A1Y2H4P9_9FUNG|nr:prolyl oligopeptidase family-domain-containing protein [Catenaria anguillulae PL171]
MEYIKQENAYADLATSATKNLQKLLVKEFVQRMDESESTAKAQMHGYDYYSTKVPGLEYRQHVEREVYLDENELAELPEFSGAPCFRVGCFRHSPCGRWVAIGVDTRGDEQYTFLFLELATKKILPPRIHNCWEDWEFSTCGDYGFYLLLDGQDRAYRVMRHTMTGSPSPDVLLWEETDPMFYLTLTKTADASLILINSAAQVTSETRCIPVDIDPTSEPFVVIPRSSGVQYVTERRGKWFYILTNEGPQANNWIFRTPLDDPGSFSRRETVLPPRDFVFIEEIVMRANYLAVFERSNCVQNIRCIDLQDATHKTYHYVPFGDRVYSVLPMTISEELADLSKHALFASDTIRFTYTTLIKPKQVIDYSPSIRKSTVVHSERVCGPTPYDTSLYESIRMFAPGEDGTAIPMSMVYRKDLMGPRGKREPRPLLLHSYAAYGTCTNPIFNPHRISLLDRGMIYCIAHVRGGSEMSTGWYLGGKKENKINTFRDFNACISYLIAENFTSPELLAIYGRSAGGLIIGNAINTVPHLIKTALTEVPFLDCLNTMSDPTLPWTPFEYEEWGNPADPVIYQAMKEYCPYTNISKRVMPHVMIIGGLNDPRVSFHELLKTTAKLRQHKLGDSLIVLKLEEGGHGGSSGQYSHLHELALEYAFLIHTLGASTRPLPPPLPPQPSAAMRVQDPWYQLQERMQQLDSLEQSPYRTPLTIPLLDPLQSHGQLDDEARGTAGTKRSSRVPAAVAERNHHAYKQTGQRGDRRSGLLYQWLTWL